MAQEIQVLTKAKKAEELRITMRTLDRWIKAGKIEFIRIPGSKRRWFLPSIKNA